jgi:hypothetical protein
VGQIEDRHGGHLNILIEFSIMRPASSGVEMDERPIEKSRFG